jgi:hypothetical protein
MTIPTTLLEVSQYSGEGYQPLIDYETWRVAILRYTEELEPQNLSTMQRHDQTDEVFVLLEGACILFLGEGEAQITKIHAQEMETLKLYNVKRACWHTHTLSKDASVLIVENRDTTVQNSPQIKLDPEQKARLAALTNKLWR